MKRLSGFTLIELLVVIAIITIMAAILFPVFATAREKARQTTCSSNMKQIGLGLMQYTADYDEYFPVGSAGVCNGTAPNMDWIDEVLPYVKSRDLFVCPNDPLNWPQTNNNINPYKALGNPYTSYKANGHYKWGGSYNIPLGVMVSLSDINGGPFKVLAVSQIVAPAEAIAVAEQEQVSMPWIAPASMPNANIFPAGTCHQTQVLLEGNQNGVSAIPDGRKAMTANGPYDFTGPNGGVTAVHNGKANFIFCDGHVKLMEPYLTNPQWVAASNMWNVRKI
ncbi:MAG TPA: DUF1559 domain-containing protein [Capsulimonadaceae bacterium]|jgi:prepilin-type N-terminal cleavage/methylation domain-containing protein/prepilin-type processing-associated H-X9-DG protein